jgi:GABA permease
MAWHTEVLVIANQTAESDELLTALKERADSRPTAFTLLVPAGPTGRDEAQARLDAALTRMREAGLEVAGRLSHEADPFAAVQEAWDPREYDEIVVSTLPTGVSKWLQVDLPHRVAKLTDAPVAHVVAHAAERSHAVA